MEIGRLVEDFLDSKEIVGLCELRDTLVVDLRDQSSYRIEILYCYSNKNAPWRGTVYSRGEVSGTWKAIEGFPWVEERDQEAAVRQCLSFLRERLER